MPKITAKFKYGSESTKDSPKALFDTFFEDASKDITVEDYCAGLTANAAAYYAEHYASLTPPVFNFSKGKRFYKVFRDEGNGGKSVHSFVEVATGHVYKADGWTAPAKGVRYFSMKDALAAADKSGNIGFLYQK